MHYAKHFHRGAVYATTLDARRKMKKKQYKHNVLSLVLKTITNFYTKNVELS